MYMFYFIFVAFVGNVAGSDGGFPLSVEKLESVGSELLGTLNIANNSDHDTTTTSAISCVKTEIQLQDAVLNALTEGPVYTRIDICSRIIMIDNPDGIDVSNKWLDIQCGLRKGRCTLNGQELSAFFVGFNANIKMDRVNFIKGYSPICPMNFINVNLDISRSSFQENSGFYGSIATYDSDYLRLCDVTFVQNSAEVANVYLYNVKNSTISSTLFAGNKQSALRVEEGSTLDLSDVTFKRNFASKAVATFEQNFASIGSGASVYVDNIAKTNFYGALFKNNSVIPLFVSRGDRLSIANTAFDSNYNNENVSSALLVGYTKVTLKGVSFVNNTLSNKEGNSLGIVFSLVKLVGCIFANNTMPVASTKSMSSVRVYDGDQVYDNGSLTGVNTTILCSNTKFCDAFTSKKTIVDQYSKNFKEPTCTASLRC